MKIRNGFVSNSSSSSFCIVGYEIGDYTDDMKNFIKPEFKEQFDEMGSSDFVQEVCGMDVGSGYENVGTYVGESIYQMDDDETLHQFKEKIRAPFLQWFTDELPLPQVMVDGGYDG